MVKCNSEYNIATVAHKFPRLRDNKGILNTFDSEIAGAAIFW